MPLLKVPATLLWRGLHLFILLLLLLLVPPTLVGSVAILGACLEWVVLAHKRSATLKHHYYYIIIAVLLLLLLIPPPNLTSHPVFMCNCIRESCHQKQLLYTGLVKKEGQPTNAGIVVPRIFLFWYTPPAFSHFSFKKNKAQRRCAL